MYSVATVEDSPRPGGVQ